MKGRYLTEQDTENSAGVVVVSEAMACQFWPGEDPIGKAIKPIFPGSTNPWDPMFKESWLQVVGVVGDVRHAGLASEPKPEMYLSFMQKCIDYLVVHTGYDPEAMISSVRDKVWEVDKTQPVAEVKKPAATCLSVHLAIAFQHLSAECAGRSCLGFGGCRHIRRDFLFC